MFFGENHVSNLSLHVLWAPVLYVMGGRLWFLGHVCSPYTCTGSTTRHYGIWASQGQESSNKQTARPLLIPHINALGLTTSFFFIESASKLHKHAHDVYIQHLYKYINVCLCPRTSNTPLQMSLAGSSPLRFGPHRLPHRIDRHRWPASSLCPPPHLLAAATSSHPSLWRIQPLSLKD